MTIETIEEKCERLEVENRRLKKMIFSLESILKDMKTFKEEADLK